VRSFVSISVLTAALALSSCASTAQTHTSAASGTHMATEGPIWKAIETPSPIGIIYMSPGQIKRVSTVDALPVPITRLAGGVPAPDMVGLGIHIYSDQYGADLQAPSTAKGETILQITADTPNGFRAISIPIVVTPHHIQEFVYAPLPGRNVSKVFVAGSFNGWSQGADELKKEADGTFKLSRPFEAGRHTYKFVVDGEWMPDPKNPLQESGGYGNSILDIRGETEQVMDLRVLGSAMRGSGPQGGVKAVLPSGDKLLPHRTFVVLNNELLSRDEFAVDETSGVIRLNSNRWLRENNVTIFTRSEANKRGRIAYHVASSDAARTPRDEVIYFPMTDRFFDGDPSLNRPSDHAELHPNANYIGGDWAGITQKIQEGYFTKLGVSTLWISPVVKNTQKIEKEFPSPNRLFSSYHGYWPVDSYATNEQFGSMDDLKQLVDTAHDHGIAVLFDFVANHVHEDHPLFKEHPDWVTPAKMPDGRDNIRLFEEVRIGTWFDTFLPTLDYTNRPEITKYQVDNAIFWMKETGIDGFRQDAVKHIPESFWKELTKRINKEVAIPEGRAVYQVGETISDRQTINLYLSTEMLTGQFDFPLYFKARDVLAMGNASMGELADEAMRSQIEYPAGAIMSPLLGNHDVTRFMAFADGDIPKDTNEGELGYTNPPQVDHAESYKKLQLAFAYLMTVPGAPAIFYGDEIGLSGAGDPDNRRPMPWGNWDENQKATHDTVSTLTEARHSSIALRRGVFQPIMQSAERVVYARVALDETVIVALCRKPSDGTATVQLPDYFGSEVQMQTLCSSDLQATVSGNKIELTNDGDYAWGIWRVE